MKRTITLAAALAAATAGSLGAAATTTPATAAGTVVIRQTASWSDVRDYDGTIWKSRGNSFDTTRTASALAGKKIPGTLHDPLYYASTWGMTKWSGAVPSSGTYRVTLFMAEDYFDAAGKRVFDVTAEGRTVLSDVDVFAAAGGKNRAYQPSFSVTVTDGRLDLGWVAKVDLPLISAIRVVKAADGSTPPPPPDGAYDQVGGLPVKWAGNSVFNINLKGAPLDGNSAAAVQNLVAQKNAGWWGSDATLNTSQYNMAFNEASPTTKRINVAFYDCQNKGYTPEDLYSGPAWFANVPVPDNLVVANGTDKATSIYSASEDKLWEFWVMERTADGGWRACHGGRIDNVSQSRGQFPYPMGVSASGLAMVGMALTPTDVRRGYVDHVISFAIPEVAPWDQPYWPANRGDGSPGSTSPLHEGMRFRLPADLDLNQYALTPIGRMVAESAKTNGLILVDRSVGVLGVNAQSGETEKQATGVDPWPALIDAKGGGEDWTVFQNWPWDKLQVVDQNWGR